MNGFKTWDHSLAYQDMLMYRIMQKSYGWVFAYVSFCEICSAAHCIIFTLKGENLLIVEDYIN